ncbi:hypothetical protein [Peribacillus sp. FSL M8-0224]|uniref:hypothetical protein n=1 Tax=Peribacillus sp. FSL M8-0224 TaxID=2921568 RepID=UPI0030FA22A1
MRHKDNPEKLLSPEKYMEIEGFDTRLAVQKMEDFLETLGDATISLIYSNKDEYKEESKRDALFIRRTHIRHAIIDFNNCFDLFLQIPWFYYRVWDEYNPNGRFYNDKLTPVLRNNDGWVEIAEQNCNFNRLKRFLALQTNQKIVDFGNKLTIFCNKFIYNEIDSIVIREIANQIKHKHSLKIKELYEPYDFSLIVNGVKVPLKDLKLGVEIEKELYDEKTKQDLGIKIKNSDDVEVSINFKGGEIFRGEDILRENNMFPIEDLYNKIVIFRDEIIDLYNEWCNLLKPNLEKNPLFANDKIRKGPDLNLDKFFKAAPN